jgi:hypothetical protein
MFSSSSPASLFLLSTFIIGKFNPNDDVIDVCKTKDVKKANNSAPARSSFQCQQKFLYFETM